MVKLVSRNEFDSHEKFTNEGNTILHKENESKQLKSKEAAFRKLFSPHFKVFSFGSSI